MDTKDHLPYEESAQLKKLGFKECCFFSFDNCSTPMRCSDLRTNDQKFYGVNYNSSSYTSQPTFAQAFRWFRDNYQLFHEIQIDQTTEPKYCFELAKFTSNPNDLTEKEWGWERILNDETWGLYRKYEEAEFACLKKLIKIVLNEQVN